MIEHVEAVVIARQMAERLVGRRVAGVVRGNW